MRNLKLFGHLFILLTSVLSFYVEAESCLDRLIEWDYRVVEFADCDAYRPVNPNIYFRKDYFDVFVSLNYKFNLFDEPR